MPITSRSKPKVEQFADRLLAADAAAQFAIDADRLDDRADAGEVYQPAVAGAVQIDQVQVLGPLGDPMPRHGGRVLAENGFPLVVALLEADAFAPRRSIAGQISTRFSLLSRTPGKKPKHVI